MGKEVAGPLAGVITGQRGPDPGMCPGAGVHLTLKTVLC